MGQGAREAQREWGPSASEAAIPTTTENQVLEYNAVYARFFVKTSQNKSQAGPNES